MPQHHSGNGGDYPEREKRKNSQDEAADRLARACAISTRQSYRYLEQAQLLKRPVPMVDAKVSFTVKLSRSLVDKLRSYAASTGLTLSEIVSRAVIAVLHRGGGRG